jgi:hypothetical protein
MLSKYHIQVARAVKRNHSVVAGATRRGNLGAGVERLRHDHGFRDVKCNRPAHARLEKKMKKNRRRPAPAKERLKKFMRRDSLIAASGEVR